MSDERARLGRENVGMPLAVLASASSDVAARPNHEGLRREILDFYIQRSLHGVVLEQIDEALSTEQLRAVEPGRVLVGAYMLLSDACRALGPALFPEEEGDKARLRTEALLLDISATLELPADIYMTLASRWEITATPTPQVSLKAAELFGVQGQPIHACQEATLGVIREDFAL